MEKSKKAIIDNNSILKNMLDTEKYKKEYSKENIVSEEIIEEKEIVKNQEIFNYIKCKTTYKNGETTIDVHVRKKQGSDESE